MTSARNGVWWGWGWGGGGVRKINLKLRTRGLFTVRNCSKFADGGGGGVQFSAILRGRHKCIVPNSATSKILIDMGL